MGKIFTKKHIISGCIFAGVFGLAMYEAYRLTPAKLIKSDKVFNKLEEKVAPLEDEEIEKISYFNEFAAKVTEAVDEGNDEYLGLNGKFNNFTVSYPSKDALSNYTIAVDGDLNVVMRSLSDLDLSVDLTVSYNNKPVDLALGLVDKNVYFAFKDFKIKSEYDNTRELVDYIFGSFFDPENEDGLKAQFDVQNVVDLIFGQIDLGAFDVSALSVVETDLGDNVDVDLKIKDIELGLTIRKEDLALLNVDLGELKFGDIAIKGGIDFNTIDKVLKLDDPLYPKQRGEFIEVISYKGWIDDALDLFKTRSLGLDLSAQINLLDEGNKTLLADISSKVDVNMANVFDFNNLNLDNVIKQITEDTFDAKSLFNLDNLEFGVDLQAKGQKDEVYSNVNLSYFDQTAYLTLNEQEDDAVMRAKISTDTVNKILDAVPNLTTAIEGLKDKDVPEDEIKEASDEIFSFITSSELVTGIKNNDFSGIIDMIKRISNDNKKIYLDIDLSKLGLGANSEVNMVLDSSRPEDKKVLSIDVKNVVVADKVEINLSLNTSKFSPDRINQIKAKKDAFDDLSFVPGVINQTSDILNEKKGKLTISGSMLDENNEGILISGAAQFDANENVGYGSINLRQLDDEIVNPNKYIDHKIDFDINNNGEVAADKNALFVYNNELKAKITLQTFVDVFNLAKDLLNSDDERFTKFKDLLGESLVSGAINDIIDNKDYLLITKPTFLKSIKQENGGNTIRVVVSKELLGMEKDISLCINFKDTEEGEKHLKGISLAGLEFSGKTVNLELCLEDFDASFKSPVNKADNFMDFSQVKVLLDFGINTTKLNYYHLTAQAQIKLSVLTMANIKLDFHIYVDGKTTKVYGVFKDVPWLSDIASNHTATCTVNTELVFEPTEDVGGKFHIVSNKDYWITDTVTYWQSDSDNFVKNIIQYLLCDCLDIRESISDSITNSSVSTDKARDPNFAKMFTEDGFKYSKNESTGVNTWNIGLNLNQILGNDTLGELKLKLNGKDTEDSGLFTDANVELGVASILTINADIKLENPDFSVKNWPSSIQSKYDKVLSWYTNLPTSKKADFDANYMNQPLKGYKMVSKIGYF
ncbi:MAG: hypothetical protein K6E21_00360 [Bacilli bacterium]|nr:hypothetical protein [Bacilli bacterium]